MRVSRAFYEQRNNRPEHIQVSEGESITFPAHLHEDLELFLVRSGKTKVEVGEEEKILSAGEFAVIFPNTVHSYEALEPDSAFTMAVCRASLLGEYKTRLVHFRPKTAFIKKENVHKDIPYAMHALEEQRKTEPNEAVYRAFVQLILARAFTCLELYEVREPKSIDLTTRLISYMTKNFRQPISLESLSKELGVSKYHLSHVFSERLHTGFNEYLNFLRLSEAIGLLSTTRDSITDICMSCGFSSQSTFNRAFLNRFSITPRQYRLLYSGIKICERD